VKADPPGDDWASTIHWGRVSTHEARSGSTRRVTWAPPLRSIEVYRFSQRGYYHPRASQHGINGKRVRTFAPFRSGRKSRSSFSITQVRSAGSARPRSETSSKKPP